MKTEVGFVVGADYQVTDRIRLTISPETSAEMTVLAMFAKRTGIEVASGIGTLVIEEPAK